MGNHENCPPPLVQVGYHLHDLVAGHRVKVPRWLITEQDARVIHECPGNRYSLLLSSGQLRGFVHCECPVNPHHAEKRVHVARVIYLPVFHQVGIFHILIRGEEGDKVELLEDVPDGVQAEIGQLPVVHFTGVPPVNAEIPARWPIKTPKLVQECGLSRTGWSHDCNKLTFFHGKGDSVEGNHVAGGESIYLCHLPELDEGFLNHGISSPGTVPYLLCSLREISFSPGDCHCNARHDDENNLGHRDLVYPVAKPEHSTGSPRVS